MRTTDGAGDNGTIDSDAEESTGNDDDADSGDDDEDDGDTSDRDKGDDDGIQPDGADISDDDADDSNDVAFNAAHQHLRGSFKTAEGITVTVVKGSIAAQKVCAYQDVRGDYSVSRLVNIKVSSIAEYHYFSNTNSVITDTFEKRYRYGIVNIFGLEILIPNYRYIATGKA